MSNFYKEAKESRNYAKSLKEAKLKMIKENLHPYYWSAFVIYGL